MSEIFKPDLREFLEALVASGNRPSPSLISAIAKLSGESVGTVENLCLELYQAAEAPVPPPPKTMN